MNESCPVCESTELHRRDVFDSDYEHRQYTLIHCGSCGVQHWSPLIHPEAAYYEGEAMSMYGDIHDGRRLDKDPRYIKFLAEFGGVRGERVLDVGCSDGALLEQMERAGNTVWGFDIDSRALEVAGRRGLRNVFRLGADDFVRKAHEEGLRFSMITAFDVLEHLTSPVAALRGLASLLVPGGRLVGTVPNRRRLLANSMSSDFPPHHFFRFDADSLRGCVEQAGMSVERVDTFQYGYSVITGLEVVRKRIKRMLAGAPPAGAPPGAPSPARGSGGRQPARGLTTATKQRIVRVITAASMPASHLIERATQRGFKLYFVARTGRGAAAGSDRVEP
jgi:2-polyprenyl-3-methyl-5-hydroxy-6-metoxy-1,4-benzoquinol methylase